ncbi:M48 family metallopeptidase [Mesobacillus subterraneus]|uniref:M48 family metallopeptidase n=1 Tax=Mesobacillus subterraneus TaxID=285983 RepID=UPI00203E2173|nr:SprT family zinc-dependent metalloprotease [Mesobacillus subterraneus]MCM3665036.1 M48 family metallopeptidase [Mesobacillus subterraneus]MCM3684051.1 M48 family metallopeptidase [Mesobacillus subterraneus]
MLHTFLGETIGYDLIYKNRKTIGIYMDLYGHVEVHAPKGTSDASVLQILEGQWDLILQRAKEMKERAGREKEYGPGGQFLYLGRLYHILISQDADIEKDNAVFEEDKLHVYVNEQNEESIKQALKRFYYQQCKALVEKRVKFYQSEFKIKPRSMRITDSKTNWGTCDSMRNLTFNWKLSMAPIEVIDYVVVHEMCHMVHMNHDRSFWRLVGKIMPEYERCERWLAVSGWRMEV